MLFVRRTVLTIYSFREGLERRDFGVCNLSLKLQNGCRNKLGVEIGVAELRMAFSLVIFDSI